jgi:hypothetical protein
VQYVTPDTSHPGTEKVVGVRRVFEHLIDHPRGPALLLIQQGRGYVDSAIVLRSGLTPIVEIQNYFARRRRVVYDYEGNRVRMRDSTADSVVRAREHTYDGDVFNFNELDVLLRSVPLRAGYEAILPLYSEGTDTVEMDTVKVLGKDSHAAWVVRFADPLPGSYDTQQWHHDARDCSQITEACLSSRLILFVQAFVVASWMSVMTSSHLS